MLERWARPHFEPGGGDAFLTYVVYGSFAEGITCSHDLYRTRGLPDGMAAWRKERATDTAWFAAWEQDYFGEQLRGSGLLPRVREAPQALVVQGTVPDPGDLMYLRDCVGVVTAVAEASGVAILDPQTLRWWSPSEWRDTLFAPDEPRPRQHAVILCSEEDGGGSWYHTRGMRKFGRPDLSIHRVPSELVAPVVDLFERFIEMQAFGAVVPDGQPVRMKSLPQGLVCRAQGDLEDHDFNNVHIEVRWPAETQGSLHGGGTG